MKSDLAIIAGPCSIDSNNIKDVLRISTIKSNGKKAIWGTRVVGLKSRSNYKSSGNGMGFDFNQYKRTVDTNGKVKPLLISTKIAQKIIDLTDLHIATELVSPMVQLPSFMKTIPKGKLLLWNPSVMQLGWPLFEMSCIAKKMDWYVGIKNGKWIGQTGENTWSGLRSYSITDKTVLIHRGFDSGNNVQYRNEPNHEVARRVKNKTKSLLFFDPSHSFGPYLRDKIVELTIQAMKMKSGSEFLYDGLLVEVGTSQTDTDQHITVDELKKMVDSLSTFRNILSPLDTLC